MEYDSTRHLCKYVETSLLALQSEVEQEGEASLCLEDVAQPMWIETVHK